jgi:hypothetical protein
MTIPGNTRSLANQSHRLVSSALKPSEYGNQDKSETPFRFAVREVHSAGLVLFARRRVSTLECDSSRTSNDPLRRLVANQPVLDLNYQVVAQSADDVQNIENAPAVSMGPYLLKSGQTSLLTSISVYSLRGESREQIRLLYMNAAAMQVWSEMGKAPRVIGAQVRPARTALLTFGVPFSK